MPNISGIQALAISAAAGNIQHTGSQLIDIRTVCSKTYLD